jgi:glycosyltransferase involved in cell wall biosynthesis
MKNILLSIIIPCFNHGKYVFECVNSIFDSKLINEIEIILINDGSNDDNFTKNTLDLLSHANLKIIHQENQGLARTRNNAIQISKGEFILPLDADNFLSDDFLITGLETLINDKTIDIVYPDRFLVFNNEAKKLVYSGEFDKFDLAFKNNIDACAIYRRNVWESVSGYSVDMPVMGYEDWDFWIKCSEKNFQFKYLKNKYFYYRVLDDSMIQSAKLKRDLVKKYLIKSRSEFYEGLIFSLLEEKNYRKRKPFKFLLKEIINSLSIFFKL